MADRILTLLREMLPAGGATPGMTDELREKLEQYESRLREVHDIANRQAADITELRSVAEVQAAQVRGAEKLLDERAPGLRKSWASKPCPPNWPPEMRKAAASSKVLRSAKQMKSGRRVDQHAHTSAPIRARCSEPRDPRGIAEGST